MLRVFTADDVYGVRQFWRQAANIVQELGADGVGVTTEEVRKRMGLDDVDIAHQRLYAAAERGAVYRAGVRGKVNLWLPAGVELCEDSKGTFSMIRDAITRLDDGGGVGGFAIAGEIGFSRGNIVRVLERYEQRGLIRRAKVGRAWRWTVTAKGRKSRTTD